MRNKTTQREGFATRQLWALVGLTMLAGAGFTLTACNTVEGVGRDVEAVGDSVADTAKDAKD